MKFNNSVSLALLLAGLVAAGSAQAQQKAAPAPGSPSPANVAQPNMPDPLSKDFRACLQKVQDASQQAKAAPDPSAAATCFTAETKRQEAKITANTQRADKGLGATEKKRLDDANVAWRHFRDVECLFFSDPKGTGVEAANNAQCVLDRTIKRALDLEGLGVAVNDPNKGAPPAGAPPPPSAPPPAK